MVMYDIAMRTVRAFALAFVAASAVGAITPASAKTSAECAQEYSAKKAAGATGGQSQKDYVKACLAAAKLTPDPAPAPAGAAHDDTDELLKKTENPLADLYIIPFNNFSTFNYGPNGQSRGTQNVLEIQPVIPIHLTPDWNLITRTVIPVVWTPDLSPLPSVPVGIAPTETSAFLSPKNPTNGFLWGVGPIVQIPTISSADLGSSVWGGGPSVVVVWTGDKIVVGALANTIWSLGGTKGPGGNSYNTSFFEPIFNYNFGEGWFADVTPNISANWQAKGTGTCPSAAAEGASSTSASCRSRWSRTSTTMSCSRPTAAAGS